MHPSLIFCLLLAAGVWRQVFYATSRFGLFETCRDKLHEIRGKTDFAGR